MDDLVVWSVSDLLEHLATGWLPLLPSWEGETTHVAAVRLLAACDGQFA